MPAFAKKEPNEYQRKENGVKLLLLQVSSLLKSMVDLKDEVEYDDLEKVIKEAGKKNPEIKEEIEASKSELNKMLTVEREYNKTETSTTEVAKKSEKQYNDLKNNLADLKAQVSEEQAKEQTKTAERQKGERQKGEKQKGEKQKAREDED